MSAARQVVVTGVFDNPLARTVRFLQEAARAGDVTVLLLTDEIAARVEGKPPKFPLAEREYFLRALRYVKEVFPVDSVATPDALPLPEGFKPDVWVVEEPRASAGQEAFCRARGISRQVVANGQLNGFPSEQKPAPLSAGRKKVVVTGSFDWFHSGHIRFFEEASKLGDLYAVVGHDANIRLLKGEGHPLFSQEERRYLVESVRFVTEALISTGEGWLDADPEIQIIKADIYAVNEDGDRGGKAEYCRQRGIEYVVLKRTPAPGLPQRSSTDLRGF
jgi:cytidyltransferase-like protein